jgi:hypothetical protein
MAHLTIHDFRHMSFLGIVPCYQAMHGSAQPIQRRSIRDHVAAKTAALLRRIADLVVQGVLQSTHALIGEIQLAID